MHGVRFQKKKPEKNYISIQGGVKLRKPSIFMSFPFSYVFTCTTTIISLKPSALNAKVLAFHTEILKNFLTLRILLKVGIGRGRR
jgi:hypothetical protein